jgi:hypothetical protein
LSKLIFEDFGAFEGLKSIPNLVILGKINIMGEIGPFWVEK